MGILEWGNVVVKKRGSDHKVTQIDLSQYPDADSFCMGSLNPRMDDNKTKLILIKQNTILKANF